MARPRRSNSGALPCANAIMTTAKFGDTVPPAAFAAMGHAMLRSLNVSLATALAFLGSLIEPAAAQQQPLRSECLAMASHLPTADPMHPHTDPPAC